MHVQFLRVFALFDTDKIQSLKLKKSKTLNIFYKEYLL